MEKDDGKLYRQKVQVKRKCCSCRNIGNGLRSDGILLYIPSRYLEEFGHGSVEEKEGRVETMAESGELE